MKQMLPFTVQRHGANAHHQGYGSSDKLDVTQFVKFTDVRPYSEVRVLVAAGRALTPVGAALKKKMEAVL